MKGSYKQTTRRTHALARSPEIVRTTQKYAAAAEPEVTLYTEPDNNQAPFQERKRVTKGADAESMGPKLKADAAALKTVKEVDTLTQKTFAAETAAKTQLAAEKPEIMPDQRIQASRVAMRAEFESESAALKKETERADTLMQDNVALSAAATKARSQLATAEALLADVRRKEQEAVQKVQVAEQNVQAAHKKASDAMDRAALAEQHTRNTEKQAALITNAKEEETRRANERADRAESEAREATKAREELKRQADKAREDAVLAREAREKATQAQSELEHALERATTDKSDAERKVADVEATVAEQEQLLAEQKERLENLERLNGIEVLKMQQERERLQESTQEMSQKVHKLNEDLQESRRAHAREVDTAEQARKKKEASDILHETRKFLDKNMHSGRAITNASHYANTRLDELKNYIGDYFAKIGAEQRIAVAYEPFASDDANEMDRLTQILHRVSQMREARDILASDDPFKISIIVSSSPFEITDNSQELIRVLREKVGRLRESFVSVMKEIGETAEPYADPVKNDSIVSLENVSAFAKETAYYCNCLRDTIVRLCALERTMGGTTRALREPTHASTGTADCEKMLKNVKRIAGTLFAKVNAKVRFVKNAAHLDTIDTIRMPEKARWYEYGDVLSEAHASLKVALDAAQGACVARDGTLLRSMYEYRNFLNASEGMYRR
jgi:hypothetical protein